MAEIYVGVKFRVEYWERKIPQHKHLNELKHWCNVFAEKKLAPVNGTSSNGNLSFRTKENADEFIITGTQVVLEGELQDEHFVEVKKCEIAENLAYISGTRNPSSETILHYAIYEKRKDVNAIFHGHMPEILRNVNWLQLIETRKEEPYGSIALMQSAIDVLGNHNFFILKNHGFVSLGRNMQEAGDLAISVLRESFFI